MTATTEQITVQTTILVCDNIHCGKQIEVVIPEDEADTIDPVEKAGWIDFREPRTDRKPDVLTFHTQKCALGFMRTVVTGKDDPEPQASDPEVAALEHALEPTRIPRKAKPVEPHELSEATLDLPVDAAG